MNPEWYAARTTAGTVGWSNEEKSAAYLCDPTIEMWSSKVDQTDENINWIMGAPSAGMYMKSYSQYKAYSFTSHTLAASAEQGDASHQDWLDFLYISLPPSIAPSIEEL